MAKPMQTVYKMLGLRIRAIREALGWTQADVARKTGLVRTSVVNIEAGRQRVLLHDVETLAAAFNITPKHLLRGIWT